MNRRALAASLFAMVAAIFLLLVVPATRLSGLPDFWKGFMMGTGGVFMIGAFVLAIKIGRSSNKGM